MCNDRLGSELSARVGLTADTHAYRQALDDIINIGTGITRLCTHKPWPKPPRPRGKLPSLSRASLNQVSLPPRRAPSPAPYLPAPSTPATPSQKTRPQKTRPKPLPSSCATAPVPTSDGARRPKTD